MIITGTHLLRIFQSMTQLFLCFRPGFQNYRIRCVPYYYIAGVSKCGSSDLNSILNHHGDVIGPPKKEVTYWNRLRYSSKCATLKQWTALAAPHSQARGKLINPMRMTVRRALIDYI